jgi:CheY-like chemotaxis protein/HPt (histidine-containing phosphotransfer) domain-containing protein
LLVLEPGQTSVQSIIRSAYVDAAVQQLSSQSTLYEAIITILAVRQRRLGQTSVTRHVEPVWPASGAEMASAAPILVVEDNAINQQVACGWLHKLGYRADVAGNGFEALEAVGRIRYGAVLMDCQLPELDGFAATAEIRRREGDGPHVPIIAMTANAMRGDRERCLAAGMDDYLSKPVKPEHLEQVLQRWMANPPPIGPTAVAAPEPELGDASLDPEILTRLVHLNRPGRPNLLSDLIRQFLEDTPRQLAALREAAERTDTRALAEGAHALKGAASHFGAERLAGLCQQLEQLPGSAGAEKMLTEADAEFARVAVLLDRYEQDCRLAPEDTHPDF